MNREPIRLLLGGDTMLGRGVNRVIHEEGPAYPFAPLIDVVHDADLFMINLECAISPHTLQYSGPSKAFYFRADPLAIDVLTDAGVDLVTLANNHALDADYQGLHDTLALLDEAGIVSVGAGATRDEARRPALLTIDGVHIGVLAYCDHQRDFAATEQRAGINYVDVFASNAADRLAGDVEALAARVDHVVVAFHWQTNWAPHVGRVYRTLAHTLVDAGATIVWGHSPHHFQGVEWIETSAVCYSTGDLVDDYALEPRFRNDRQLLFRLTLTLAGVTGVEALPLELEFARTSPAGAEARAWIVDRFEQMCAEIGSRIDADREWIEVLPT